MRDGSADDEGAHPRGDARLRLSAQRVSRAQRSRSPRMKASSCCAALGVLGLHGRGLHEVRRRRQDRAADAAVLGDLRGADGVDDDAGRVGRVPDLELVLEVQGHLAERATLEADVGPLAVVEPGDVVRRADVDVAVLLLAAEGAAQVGGDGLRLGELLGLQAVALEHVLEVHVAADVQLVRAVQHDAAVLEQLREHAVRDGGADLRLDVVADDRDTGGLELRGPLRVGRDEDGQRVDERDAGVDGALGVVLRGDLGPDGQVADEDVGTGLAQGGDDVDRLGVGLGDGLAVVLAEAVVGDATLHGHAERRDVGDLDGVVLRGADGLGQVEADLLRVHVERGDELDVADVVVAELHVHQAGHGAARVGVGVVVHALDERRGAVADADDGDADGGHPRSFSVVRAGATSSSSTGVSATAGGRCLRDGCGARRARCRSARRASGLHARPVRGRAAGARGCTRPCARGCGRRTGGPSRGVRSGASADPRGSGGGSRRRSARRRRTGRRSSRPPTRPVPTTRAPAGGAPCRRPSAGRRSGHAWTPRRAGSPSDSMPWIHPRSTSDLRQGYREPYDRARNDPSTRLSRLRSS